MIRMFTVTATTMLLLAPTAHAIPTGDPYTPGGTLSAHLAWDGSDCARWIYPTGESEQFCTPDRHVRAVFRAKRGDIVGAHSAPEGISFATCELIDDASGNTIAVDAGWAANCVMKLN